jgi:hypothetical protein
MKITKNITCAAAKEERERTPKSSIKIIGGPVSTRHHDHTHAELDGRAEEQQRVEQTSSSASSSHTEISNQPLSISAAGSRYNTMNAPLLRKFCRQEVDFIFCGVGCWVSVSFFRASVCPLRLLPFCLIRYNKPSTTEQTSPTLLTAAAAVAMEESKVQALHDTLSKLKRSAGLGVSSHYNFGGKCKTKEVNGQIVREDGLPNNPLYHGFVREGTYDPKASDAAKYGDGRVIKRDFEDCKGLVSSSSGSEDNNDKLTQKKLKKGAKKQAKLEAKRQAKLEAKRQAKLEAKRQAKLEALAKSAVEEEDITPKSEKKKKKKADKTSVEEKNTPEEVKNDEADAEHKKSKKESKKESKKRKNKEDKTSKKKKKRKKDK